MNTPPDETPRRGDAPGQNAAGVRGRMDRRDAIKWMLAAAASATLLDRAGFAAAPAAPSGKGYGTDPDLLKAYKPGDLWPLTLTPAQHAIVTALCDTIIPADERGPAASAVGVPDFVDEWISAPYPGHDEDRAAILKGLEWLDAESRRRSGAGFAKLAPEQRNAIADDICDRGKAKPAFREPAQFFQRFRDIVAGGYYTTPEGMKDIGYIGNMPLVTFDGPPPAALQQLGLA